MKIRRRTDARIAKITSERIRDDFHEGSDAGGFTGRASYLRGGHAIPHRESGATYQRCFFRLRSAIPCRGDVFAHARYLRTGRARATLGLRD